MPHGPKAHRDAEPVGTRRVEHRAELVEVGRHHDRDRALVDCEIPRRAHGVPEGVSGAGDPFAEAIGEGVKGGGGGGLGHRAILSWHPSEHADIVHATHARRRPTSPYAVSARA